jgi:type IX secretion system substrate protein
MKRVLLIIAFTVIGSVQVVFSQVVINKVDFPLESNYQTYLNLEYRSGLEPPSSGDGQTWDLSNLMTTHYIDQTYVDASGDDFYTDAVNYRISLYIFNGFDIDSKDFYVNDDQGYARIGRRITEVEYSIAQITGGPNDKLKMVGGNFPFEGRENFIKFPLQLDKSWTESYTVPTHYELTVEGFGLNETPGVFNSYETQTRTVVGSGKLTIPDKEGGVMTINALLIKSEYSDVDSVFLGGQPAPPQLMAAFGLTQGATSSSETYEFYSPGFGQFVASYDMTEEYVSYSEVSKAKSSVAFEVINLLNVYPNPVKSGTILNISNSKFDLTNVVLVDQAGKVVLENQMNGKSNLSIPNSVSTGTYLLNSYDVNGTIISTNKIIIE